MLFNLSSSFHGQFSNFNLGIFSFVESVAVKDQRRLNLTQHPRLTVDLDNALRRCFDHGEHLEDSAPAHEAGHLGPPHLGSHMRSGSLGYASGSHIIVFAAELLYRSVCSTGWLLRKAIGCKSRRWQSQLNCEGLYRVPVQSPCDICEGSHLQVTATRRSGPLVLASANARTTIVARAVSPNLACRTVRVLLYQ